MKANGEDIKDLQIVENILRTLTERFEGKVTAIEESQDLNAMTVDDLMSSLQAYEQRLNVLGPTPDFILKLVVNHARSTFKEKFTENSAKPSLKMDNPYLKIQLDTSKPNNKDNIKSLIGIRALDYPIPIITSYIW
ncbi:hypothetical protein ACLB2K_046447 [Fragaria x ananassa]